MDGAVYLFLAAAVTGSSRSASGRYPRICGFPGMFRRARTTAAGSCDRSLRRASSAARLWCRGSRRRRCASWSCARTPTRSSSPMSSRPIRPSAMYVLRIAASAPNRPAMPIVSLTHAVAWLGLDEVANMAFTLALQPKMLDVPGHQRKARRLWRHSLASALWSRQLALALGREPGLCYLCGLLHDIGKAVTLREAHELARWSGTLLESVGLRPDRRRVSSRGGGLRGDHLGHAGGDRRRRDALGAHPAAPRVSNAAS